MPRSRSAAPDRAVTRIAVEHARAPASAGHPPFGQVPALRLALLVLTAAWLALFAPQLFARQVFVLGDARVYQPFAEYSRQRWLEHRQRTHWNPFVMEGVAASASLADMRPQYLPDAALDLFERLRPGRLVPLAAPLLAHLLGMWAIAALASALWALPAVALVWAGLAWGLSPLLLVPLAFGHTAYFVAVSLLPAMLLAVHALARSTTRGGLVGAGLALAGIAGVQALNGHPQVVAYAGATALAFAIERAIRARRPVVAIAAALALAWGAAIAAAVWWPAALYGAHSVRGGGGVAVERVLGMSLAWPELLAFAFPRIVGGAGETYWGGLGVTDYPRFFGTTVVVLAALALLRRGRAPREARLFFAMVVLAAVVLALGPRLGAVYTAMRAALPILSRFWVASMALVIAVPALALLSAAGLAEVTRAANGDRARRGGAFPWVIVAALSAIGLLLLTFATPAYVALVAASRDGFPPELAQRAARVAGVDLVLRALLLAALATIVMRWRRREDGRGPRVAAIGVVVLLLCDLGIVSLPTLRRASGPEAVLTARPEPALARIGREDPAARVLSTRTEDVSSWQTHGLGMQPEMRINDWVRWRVRAHGGQHGTPAATWEEFTFLQGDALRAFGIVYVSSPPGTPQDTSAFELLERGPDELVYRVRDGLGRAYAVGAVSALASEVEVARAMLAPGFRADSVAYTQAAAASGDYAGSVGARIDWVEDEPDALALRVDAPAPAFLVIADAWFPGWTATLDRAPAPIHRVNRSLRGIAIPAGAHELRMRYAPEGFAPGTRVTRAALALWLLALAGWLVARWTMRRAGAPAVA